MQIRKGGIGVVRGRAWWLAGVAGLVIVAASGCASQTGASPPASHHHGPPVPSAANSMPLHGTWVMPTTLPKAWFAPAMPEFSAWPSNAPQPTSTFATWQPPASWDKYLLKNEPSGGTAATIGEERALFITLQGVVYLYPADIQWQPLVYDDIPPGATIVAEYVPVAKAVRAGVVPVYRLPLTEVGGVLPAPWQRVLHLRTVAQLQKIVLPRAAH